MGFGNTEITNSFEKDVVCVVGRTEVGPWERKSESIQ